MTPAGRWCARNALFLVLLVLLGVWVASMLLEREAAS